MPTLLSVTMESFYIAEVIKYITIVGVNESEHLAFEAEVVCPHPDASHPALACGSGSPLPEGATVYTQVGLS